MFVSMDSNLTFENCLKHWLVHETFLERKEKLGNHWLSVH
jgi:hypothetical protein